MSVVEAIKRIRTEDYVDTWPKDPLSAVREQGLEGIIGKRKDSHYQPGKRSGAWIKYRAISPDHTALDSLIVGHYDGDKLMYVARTRNGFVPAFRREVFSKLKHLVTPACPFVNLPETRRSRFGEELNAEKMKKAVWLMGAACVMGRLIALIPNGARRLGRSKRRGGQGDSPRRALPVEGAGRQR